MEDRLYTWLKYYQGMPQWLRGAIGSLYRQLPLSVRFGPEHEKVRNLLAETEFLCLEELEMLQFQELRRLLKHASVHVPYYQRVYAEQGILPSDIQSVQDIAELPFVTKEAVRGHHGEFTATNVPRDMLLRMNTGGSTGLPLELYYEKGVTRAREWAFTYHAWSRVGYRIGDRLAVLRGTGIRDSLWQYEPIRNRLVMSAYHLNERTLDAYVAKMRQFRPKYLHVYPSTLTVVAKYMQRYSLPPISSVKAILAASENMFPEQRSLFERVFDCRTFCMYGQGELAAMGAECEHSSEYHFFPEFGILELVAQNGAVIRKPGVLGEIVGTGFNNYAMPLIRYRTGDMGVWAEGPCSCGRAYPRLARVEGRKQELVITSDGSIVTLTGLIFGQHFHAFGHIAAMQLEQVAEGGLLVRVVPGDDYDAQEDEAEIRTKMLSAVSGKLDISFECVDRIPRTRRGKHRFLIQHLPIDEYLENL